MLTPYSSKRNLAARLLAASRADTVPSVHGLVLVNDRLRAALVRITGDEGFAALQQRALMLARSELPPLKVVNIDAHGRLTGFEHLPDSTAADAAMAITARLLDLLANIIGDSLTLRLLREAWPNTVLDV